MSYFADSKTVKNDPSNTDEPVAYAKALDVAGLFALLMDIRTELRILNANLTAGLNVQDDTTRQRTDPYYAG